MKRPPGDGSLGHMQKYITWHVRIYPAWREGGVGGRKSPDRAVNKKQDGGTGADGWRSEVCAGTAAGRRGEAVIGETVRHHRAVGTSLHHMYCPLSFIRRHQLPRRRRRERGCFYFSSGELNH